MKVVRTRIELNEKLVVDLLSAFAEERAGIGALLRIYWYDASPGKGLNAAHIRLSQLDNVKLRLGIINAYNEQKGVDSLLIADLIQLAHNRAIDSAVLLSGDEDLRVGVQVAQAYGVRVHLLGLNGAKARSSSQSQALFFHHRRAFPIHPLLPYRGNRHRARRFRLRRRRPPLLAKFRYSMPA